MFSCVVLQVLDTCGCCNRGASVLGVLIKCSRIPFRNLYSSHSARAAFGLGEVIGNIFVLASGNLINVFFWH